MIIRTIIRVILTLFGLLCLFDGTLNAYRLYSLEFRYQASLLPQFSPWAKIGIGVLLIILGLVIGGLLERVRGRQE